jgi:hypothetical protein
MVVFGFLTCHLFDGVRLYCGLLYYVIHCTSILLFLVRTDSIIY